MNAIKVIFPEIPASYSAPSCVSISSTLNPYLKTTRTHFWKHKGGEEWKVDMVMCLCVLTVDPLYHLGLTFLLLVIISFVVFIDFVELITGKPIFVREKQHILAKSEFPPISPTALVLKVIACFGGNKILLFSIQTNKKK